MMKEEIIKIIKNMRRCYLIFMLSPLTLNACNAQSVEKNSDTKFINFVNSFKEKTDTSIVVFRRIINNKAPMSKEEALEFVYHTDDTTKLYCVEFDYSNENEEFRGILGTFMYLPDKCLKIDMGNYFFIAYNSYQCTNSCPDPQKLYDCFRNDHQECFLTLCIVDKGFNIKDSMIVCNDDGNDSNITGLLNPKNGKVFLLHTYADWKKPDMHESYIYEINKKSLKCELIKNGNVSKKTYTDDLIGVLEKLEWMELFIEYF